jgi:SecD/SecF fusion protein
MKYIKWMGWGVILIALVGNSFSFASSGKIYPQPEKVIFCETYSQQEVVSKLAKNDPLFNMIQLETNDPESSRLGTCSVSELDKVRDYVQSASFRSKVPGDLVIVPGAEEQEQKVRLYAIKQPGTKQPFPSKEDISAVGVDYDEPNDSYALTITFSESAAGKWAAMTRKNIGKDIAILYGDRVIFAPRVTEEIKGGLCSISGNFTENEARKMKEILED